MKIISNEFEPGTHIYPFAESIEYVRAVGRGEEPATLRFYQPAPNVAFGRRDEHNPGFEAAAYASRCHGFQPLVRPVGGHAAGYHAGCLVVDHFQPAADAVSGNNLRFQVFGDMYARVLRALGATVAVGEIPGEYCPGEYSVHAALSNRKIKIVGTAQRVVAGAWWFSAGIVVEHDPRLTAVTEDVYRALNLPLDPTTVGALTDANPRATAPMVQDATLTELKKMGFH